jgi:hypothetical protein
MAEPLWLRHDLGVVAIAALVLGAGWLVSGRAGAEPQKRVALAGVTVSVPAGWIVDAPAGVARGDDAIARVEVQSGDAPPEGVDLDTARDLDRGHRYGDLYQRTTASIPIQAGGRTWLRTRYAYAFKPSPSHAPRVATAIEYARVAAGHVTVVTVHGATDERAAELEHLVLGTVEASP